MVGELRQRVPVLVSGAAGVMLGVSALPAYVLGVFAGPMTREFGWSLAAYQGAIVAFSAGILLASAPVGVLCDRYGARAVALWGLPLGALGVASLGLVQAPAWTFYVAMLLAALLGSGTLPTIWTRMVTALFERSRGLALGIVLSGSSVFAAIGPTLAQRLIDGFGWRAAWALLALLPLLVAWPLAIAGFRGEEAVAARPAATPRPSVTPAAAGDACAAFRDYRFWVLATGFTLVTLGVGGLNPNLVPMLGTKGFTPAGAASVMAAFGVAMGVGRLLTGWLIDRIWAPGVAAVVLALPAVSALLLLGEAVSPSRALLAVALLGFAQGAEYDFLAYLVARYFGLSHYGRIYGVILLPIVIATAAGAIAVARTRDLAGAFDPALPVIAMLFAIGGAILVTLGRYPTAPPARP